MGDRPIYERLADLYGAEIDKPSIDEQGASIAYDNPMYGNTPLKRRFYSVVGRRSKLIPDDLGVLQNPPQYRGSRMTLPQSAGEYGRPPLSPENEGLRQEVYGELIRRGYPVLGGVGQFYGREKGFNPIGFGQR